MRGLVRKEKIVYLQRKERKNQSVMQVEVKVSELQESIRDIIDDKMNQRIYTLNRELLMHLERIVNEMEMQGMDAVNETVPRSSMLDVATDMNKEIGELVNIRSVFLRGINDVFSDRVFEGGTDVITLAEAEKFMLTDIFLMVEATMEDMFLESSDMVGVLLDEYPESSGSEDTIMTQLRTFGDAYRKQFVSKVLSDTLAFS